MTEKPPPKKRERIYKYYVEPSKRGFARTNEVLMKHLADTTGNNSVDTHSDANDGVLCADGKKHPLIGVPSGQLLMLWSSRSQMKISFRIFCQEGNGTPRDITKWYTNQQGKKRNDYRGKF